ncbi:MAG: hypothetical protein FWF29_01960, partial [Treponema sp.]|nr:hypothetical protein [Treponema sp.]
ISVSPRIMYFPGQFLGKTLSIELQYFFNIMQFSKYGNEFTDNGYDSYTGAGIAPFRDSQPLIRNVVQLQFGIQF